MFQYFKDAPCLFDALRARLNEGWTRQLFDCDDAAEVVPVEKHAGETKASIEERICDGTHEISKLNNFRSGHFRDRVAFLSV